MKKIDDLVLSFKAEVIDLTELCDEQGVKMIPYFTVRDPWTQAKLWRQSRTRSEITRAIRRLKNGGAPWLAEVVDSAGPQYGKHATNALPGMSWHQWGEAIDCYVENATGGAIWDGQHPGYEIYADTAVELGLTAGYYSQSLFDSVHVQARSANVKDLYTLAEIDQAMRDRFAMTNPEAVPPSDFVYDDEHFSDEDAVNQDEVDIMARTIFGEASGEFDQGKVAIGWVIMNRIEFAQARGGHWWGNTIRDVCLKPWQFSCWNSNNPNRRVIQNITSANSNFCHCLDIAKKIITRKVLDPVGGAMHYYANHIPPPFWVKGATFVTKIGVHRFYRDVS